MKRINYESYSEFGKIDKAFKDLKIHTVLSAIKKSKDELNTLTEKFKTTKIQEEAIAYYNGCLEISNKIKNLKLPTDFPIPRYKIAIEDARNQIKSVNECFNTCQQLYSELKSIEYNCNLIQRRTEKATNYLAFSKTEISRISIKIDDLCNKNKANKQLLKDINEKIVQSQTDTQKLNKIITPSTKLIDFSKINEEVERKIMFKEDFESKNIEISRKVYESQMNILENNTIIERNNTEILSYNIEIQAKSNNLSQLEIELLEQDKNLNIFKSNLEVKEKSKEILKEKLENSNMSIEDNLITAIRLLEKKNFIERELEDKIQIKVYMLFRMHF